MPVLLTTGLGQLAPEILAAAAQPAIDGHGEAAFDLVVRIRSGMRTVLGAATDTWLLPGTGMAGLEAALCNHFSPSEHVLACVNGFFSEYFSAIASGMGLKVTTVRSPRGEGINWVSVEQHLVSNRDIRGLLFVHHETSTGTLTDLRPVGTLCEQFDLISVGNFVSSAGGVAIDLDAHGVDVAVAVSHKGMMSPAGIVFIATSDRARNIWKQAGLTRFYWDLQRLSEWNEKRVLPFDPPLPQLYALDRVLSTVFCESPQANYDRVVRNAELFRGSIAASGLEIVALTGHRAPNATVVALPEPVSSSAVRSAISNKYGIELSGGIGENADTVVRVTHQGWVDIGALNQAAQALVELIKADAVA